MSRTADHVTEDALCRYAFLFSSVVTVKIEIKSAKDCTSGSERQRVVRAKRARERKSEKRDVLRERKPTIR